MQVQLIRVLHAGFALLGSTSARSRCLEDVKRAPESGHRFLDTSKEILPSSVFQRRSLTTHRRREAAHVCDGAPERVFSAGLLHAPIRLAGLMQCV